MALFSTFDYLLRAAPPCSGYCSGCCVTAIGESEAASGARRWLARNAAAVNYLDVDKATAVACTSLVSCLSALEQVHLELSAPIAPDGLGRLLEALACLPSLDSLDMSLQYSHGFDEGLPPTLMLHSLAPFAQLRSLTDLSLNFYGVDLYSLADVVHALVSLTGLVQAGS